MSTELYWICIQKKSVFKTISAHHPSNKLRKQSVQAKSFPLSSEKEVRLSEGQRLVDVVYIPSKEEQDRHKNVLYSAALPYQPASQ